MLQHLEAKKKRQQKKTTACSLILCGSRREMLAMDQTAEKKEETFYLKVSLSNASRRSVGLRGVVRLLSRPG